jgi:ABC-type dipeptide/oligopeptide/nickel transport system permease subunit
VIIVAATLRVAHVILIESGLSYLGLGVPPPTASWGGMVADGREHLFHAAWVSFSPGLCIFLTVMTYNLVGDGLRDALDPRTR